MQSTLEKKVTYQLAGILDNSVVNGKGLRTVLFFSGCPHHCKGCQNAELQNYTIGKQASLEAIMRRVKENSPYISGVTLSGGDPFEQDLTQLLMALKEENINVWTYTGYTYELLLNDSRPYIKEMLKYVDVLVDGKYDENFTEDVPKYVGSSNQRFIILDKGKVIDIRSEF